MPEYIDRENYCIDICLCNEKKCDKERCSIHTAPVADVVKVRHGEWIVEVEYETALSGRRINKIKTYHCPYCKKRFRQKMKFCGNCGAEMDGDKSE